LDTWRMVRGCSSAGRDGRTARWPSAPPCGEHSAFQSPITWTMRPPRRFPTLAYPRGFSLKHRAKLASDETVLILGATGVTGKLAVQIAKILGAGRVVAAGRNEQVLSTLHELGADVTIQLDKPDHELIEAFRREAGEKDFDVIVDYLWGPPTEALLAAITHAEFAFAGSETRLVEVGESAGPTITLPAAVLRSAALTILGTAGIPPWEVLTDALQQVMEQAACGKVRVETDRVALKDIEGAWERDVHGRRLVVIP
jgi:NADPH:quinone reductase-like Zn-dependent oxidoreductase